MGLQYFVKANEDIEFQHIRHIARLDPFELSKDDSIKEDFFQTSSIGLNMMCTFSLVQSPQEVSNEFRESINFQLLQNDNNSFSRIDFFFKK